MNKINFFRKKYSRFIYEKYSWRISKGNLEIFFNFSIPGIKKGNDIKFSPRITIKNIDKKGLKKIGDKVLNNLIFHLGLIEIPSYWKVTCSPEIIIKAGSLNKNQIKWWKNLILKGMGEFFYKNKIDFRKSNFLKIISAKNNIPTGSFLGILSNRTLVPISGGKDSTVTLELLKNAKKELSSFSLNPTLAAQKTIKIIKQKNAIIISRKIDKKLLELNRQGFLNGHTPFSAYLAFLTVLSALIFDYKYIAFSNERSANEGNLKYLGETINHQWSKTFDFEKNFREYSKKYLAKNVEYFSFLRPLYEIQVVRLFSKYPKYFSSFISCNEAFKTYSGTRKPTKRWCNSCSKCLFVFSYLYPFLTKKDLIKIFGQDLFEKRELLPMMKQLIGIENKPFECVGTKKESLIAFYLSLKKIGGRASGKSGKIPFLLKYFQDKILPKQKNIERESKKILNSWNKKHFLPKNFGKILKNS